MKDVKCVLGVVDRRLIGVVILVVSIFLSYPAYIQGQAGFAQEPEVQWEMATWSPVDEDGNPHTQYESGEDWAYDVEVSYDGASPDGYIYAGYTTFPGYDFTSGGCPCSATKGCAIPKLFKTDLEGNLLWYETYSENAGELTAVIQTSDGGYLGVGRSRERANRLTYYGETSSTGSLTGCPTIGSRNIYAVKTSASGAVQWEYIYGISNNPNDALLKQSGEAWDVVEMPGGPGSNFRIVGHVLDSNDSARDLLGGYITKAFILEINSSGVRQWIKVYGDSGNASIARGIARDGNDYAVVLNQFDQAEYLEDAADADIWVYKVGSGSNPNPVFKTNLTGSTTEHDFGYDIIYNTAGAILVSGVINCTNPGGCFRNAGARGEGTARVYRRNASNGNALDDTGSALGTVKGFDLWATMAATSDGGSVFVSTKQPIPQGSNDFTETDAFVAKINSGASDTDWEFTYDAETTKTHLDNEGMDIGYTNQECLYAIVPAPNGGYTISGNNSSNFDDDYVVRFEDVSAQTVDNTTVDHEHIYYFGPDDLTIGPSFTVENTAYVELIARNSITIVGPFVAKLGSTFEAEVDPNFSGVQTRFVSAPEAQTAAAGELDAQDHTNDSAAKEGTKFTLEPNYPNPFNPSTEIRFSLPEAMPVTLVVYDVLGREVARLLDGTLEAGMHRVRWNASSLPNGVYLYRLEAGSFTKTQRMTLVK